MKLVFDGIGRTAKVWATALALLATAVGGVVVFGGLADGAWAQTSGGAGNGNAGNGNGSQGNGQDNAGNGQGQGGPSADSEGQGPQAGSGSGGGKPAWASEGLPDVELGRLNVARSPDNVLDRSYDEAISNVTPDVVAFYNQSLADMVTTLSLDFDNATYIDSPLQNLALLRDILQDGTSGLTALGVTTSPDTLMAVFIGAASDKTQPISVNTVIALTIIMG